MSFNKKKYQVIRGAISKEVAMKLCVEDCLELERVQGNE